MIDHNAKYKYGTRAKVTACKAGDAHEAVGKTGRVGFLYKDLSLPHVVNGKIVYSSTAVYRFFADDGTQYYALEQELEALEVA